LEQYFNYRWSQDKNLAVSTEGDLRIMKQMPYRVQSHIFIKYLFKPFIETYKQFFEAKKVVIIKR